MAAADQCVRCGLCLPHCPTYGLYQNEAESPRGRIAIMTALANGSIEADTGTRAALDHCLTCRACETACPAQVPYGQLIDAARQHWPPRRRWRTAWLERAVTTRAGLILAGLGLAFARPLLQALATLPVRSWRRQASLLPRGHRFAAQHGTSHAAAHLMPGCVAQLTNAAALDAFQSLCSRLDAPVTIAPGADCCGAIAQHNGMTARAERHRSRNTAALAADDLPIVHLDSGCAAELRESSLGARVIDACDFLDSRWPAHLMLRPTTLRVGLHVPCTQRHVMRNPDAALRLLNRIPGLTIVPLAAPERCCGAAGTHVVNEPEQADALVDPKARSAVDQQVDVILTTNAGCAVHLQGALRRLGSDMPVQHPAQLLLEHFPDD